MATTTRKEAAVLRRATADFDYRFDYLISNSDR